MATQVQPSPPVVGTGYQEIRIVSHSNLFYWWPVWAFGFALCLLTLLDPNYMVLVPKGTHAEHNRVVQGMDNNKAVDVYVLPEGKSIDIDPQTGAPIQPHLHAAREKSYGVLYAIVLLLVIVITNVPLRGLWSVVVIVIIVLMSIIFQLAGWWDAILNALGLLRIHINAAGYLLISTALFIIWLMTFVLFDPQIYMIFTPGQLRVRQEIGGGEVVYDTAGMVIQKQRNDLFRHWVLGLGSGDLIVTTSGAAAHHFDLPNVLFVGYKVRQIEDMLREKPVVQG
ncbi:MAG TPA: hypothetical protein VKU02_01725 [Gemmataceae bacterium]|nr:hypothetical protein [Gemmataceae bacterium]